MFSKTFGTHSHNDFDFQSLVIKIQLIDKKFGILMHLIEFDDIFNKKRKRKQ